MKFDEAYEKVLNGTATEEEKEYVREQVRKAEKIESLLSEEREPVTVTADAETIKKARKQVTLKGAFIILIAVIACLVIAAGAICGGIFGTAVSSAKSAQKIDDAYAEALAETEAAAYVYRVTEEETVDSRITDFDKDLEINSSRLKSSVYVYYIDVQIVTAAGIYEVDIAVNSSTGFTKVVDFDRE